MMTDPPASRPAPVPDQPRDRCWALRVDGGGRYVCDRTDPHPSDFGSDSEGHRWVLATSEQWALACAVQEALHGGLTILKSEQR